MSEVLQRLGRQAQGPRVERWYTGVIAGFLDDGSYDVYIAELNTVCRGLVRGAPDRSRLLIGEQVAVHQRGGLVDLL